MKKRHGKKRSYSKYIAVMLVGVIVLSCALALVEMYDKKQGLFADDDPQEEVYVYNGVEYEKKQGIETLLVMGLDKFADSVDNSSYNNDQQADFVMLLVFDKETEQCSAIHINRDTMVNISVLGVAGEKIDTVNKQLALSHTYGNGGDISCRNVAESVSDLLLGVDVDHYISTTMDAVSVLTDYLGGVEVEIMDDFTGIDDTLVKGEVVNLRGEHALNYVRARQGVDDSTNSNRMNRQKQFLNAVYEKAVEKADTDEDFAVRVSSKLSDYIVSDRSVTQLQSLADRFAQYEFAEIKTLNGEIKEGEKYLEFYPDKNSVEELVYSLFYTPVE